VLPFWYPPPSLLCFYPLSWFSYDTVQTLSLLINHALLLVLLWLVLFRILRLMWGGNWRFMALAVVYMLSFYPSIATIYYGQVNMLVGICLCLTWLAIREKRGPALIAIPLTAAMVLKSYPVVLLLLLLMLKRYRAVIWTLALSAVVALLSWLILPSGVWEDFASKVLPGGGYGNTMPGLLSPAVVWNQSINGFTSRLFLGSDHSTALWFSEAAARVVPYFLSAVVAALSLGWCWRSARKFGVKQVDVHMAVMLTMLYLVAPFTWEHHGVFILPVVLIMLQRLLPVWREHLISLTVLSMSAFVLAWYLPFQSPKLAQGWPTLLISIKFYAAVGIWAVAVILPRKAVVYGR